MQHYEFSNHFARLYDQAIKAYQAGKREASTFFSPEENTWINANGLTAQNFLDYAEDHLKYDGEPGLLIAHSIESIRRDYFLNVQHGIHSTNVLNPDTMPAKSDSIDGIEWLPRIIPKALAKLYGELPSSLMYCCAGDRRFFRQHNIHSAEFLALVWRHRQGNIQAALLEFIKTRAVL